MVMMVVAVMMMTTVEVIVADFDKNNDDNAVNTMSNVFSVHAILLEWFPVFLFQLVNQFIILAAFFF